ncbi:coiled-coil domain-containing protein 43-like [Clavelina lepadiformis]|uniref:Coiled-coil domain-containing protein 43 n=1 Tax=Clavelina lepadiformis TaxID=159417 RepID=A0ABP0EZB6_CLALP
MKVEMAALSGFDDWLCKKLTSLDIDNNVYGAYIVGILEENEEEPMKKEALTEILESVVEDSAILCNEVLQSWQKMKGEKEVKVPEPEKKIDDIIAAHVGVSSGQKIQNNSDQKLTKELDSIKQSVIAMYSSVHDGADFEENPENDVAAKHRNTVDSALKVFQNDNAEKITQAEKMERQKRKEESAKKKEQDRADRELQKIKKTERKDKEKKRTQKKERSR